jgi:amidophosphoribosyltransferase
VRHYIGLDSLGYLSLNGLIEATRLDQNGFCLACFDGNYPIQPEEGLSKLCLES